jgi:hypothetical protein
MTEDEARKFAEIWHEELLRKYPAVAFQMRRGMQSPSRILPRNEGRRGDTA